MSAEDSLNVTAIVTMAASQQQTQQRGNHAATNSLSIAVAHASGIDVPKAPSGIGPMLSTAAVHPPLIQLQD
jgi:hypothetical protein